MKEDLKRFLEFAYFGDIENENVIEICAQKAYLDLSRNIPYTYSVSMLNDPQIQDSNEISKEEFNKIKGEFYKKVIGIFKDISPASTPIELIEAIKKMADSEENKKIFNNKNAKVKEFSLGLCQKWVNMTLKYLWLLDKCPIDENKLHAPLDSYIIHAITQTNKDKKYGLCLKIEDLTPNLSWSQLIDKKLYEDIQEELKKEAKDEFGNKCPVIKWENLAWIEQSKSESKKKTKK